MSEIKDEPMTAEVVRHRRVWDGAVFDMDEDVIALPQCRDHLVRHYVAHPGAVAIVALRPASGSSGGAPETDADYEVAMVDQYRHPVQARLWEIPAGLLDVEGEDPLEAAQRELWEEADLYADTWHTLVDYFTSPGASTEGLRIFLARQLRAVPVAQRHHREDEEAAMQLRWVRLDELVAAIHGGEIHNPSAVVGALAAANAVRDGFKCLRSAQAPWLRSPFNRAGREEGV